MGAVASPVIVVLGCHSEAIRGARDRATLVVNPNPGRGMLSSLQCGLRAVPPEADAVLFTPVDYPAVEAGDDSRAGGRRILGAAGHPGFREPARPSGAHHAPAGGRDPRACPEHARASDVIHRYLDRAMMIEVQDRGVVEDIDDPETYQRLRRECGE